MSTLLVASSGGHLKQLHRLFSRLEGIDEEVTWVTFDTAQARSLLEGQEVLYTHLQESRDYAACGRNVGVALRLLRKRRFRHVVSTGSGVALAFLPAARALGARCHYIESATRSDGPSLTGKALQMLPGISLYTQHPCWQDGRWRYRGSVLDGFVAHEGPSRPIQKAVVTIGTLERYPFPRLLGAAARAIPAEADVLWQTSSTPVGSLGIVARPSIPASDLQAAMSRADVVVAHAGTGSALAALEAGHCPVLVPRRAKHGEHVDDHQLQIAAELDARGLAIACEAEDLSTEVLERAASRTVSPTSDVRPFPLS